MPKSDDIHATIAFINAVNHAIGADHNFTNRRLIELRHDSPKFRELGQTLYAAEQELTKCDGTFRGIKREVADDVLQIPPR